MKNGEKFTKFQFLRKVCEILFFQLKTKKSK